MGSSLRVRFRRSSGRSSSGVTSGWGVGVGELVGEEVAEAGELEGAGDGVGSVGLADGGVVFAGLVVLVCDVADDGFEEVFDGDDAGDGSVLVNDDAHVLLGGLHLAEEFGDHLGLGDEGGGALDLGDGEGGGVGIGDLEEVVGEGDAGDVVEGVAEDGDAGEDVGSSMAGGELLEGEGLMGTAKISGRGVMTSRTTLSPNSTTERRSSRSDSSRMPSSSPASRRASMASEG